jgi:FdhD protein
MSSRSALPTAVARVDDGTVVTVTDHVAVEEPLEIRVDGPDARPVRVAVTMRTPGHDDELAVGFLRTEGLLTDVADLVVEAAPHRLDVANAEQIVTVRLSRAFDATSLTRNFYATSSCGVCGKAALEHIRTMSGRVGEGPRLDATTLLGLPAALATAQTTFARTGGLHATALFDETGRLLLAREDVGRHNAMDKVIGRAFLDGLLPLDRHVVLVSGRASFELVQKAAMAGVTVLCAVSAPSSLAVSLAQEVGMTLVGFLREGRFNVYSHPARVALGPS